jgi:urease accessory protein
MVQFRFFKMLQPLTTRTSGACLVAAAGLLLLAMPALAHHPHGGEMPTNALQGFLSGLGHPVIGLDHLAFVVAAGLLAAAVAGLIIPLGFVLASLVGTGMHLMALTLPAPEFFISASVLMFGALLAMRQPLSTWILTGLAALAGVFHGYAYGEAIVGADAEALLAYLAGFAVVQVAISATAYGIAKRLVGNSENALGLRFAGFTLFGVGAAFLSGVVLG